MYSAHAPMAVLEKQEADDRRLARTGGADEEDELALVDHEGDVAEGDDVRVVDLRDRVEDDHGAGARLDRRRRLQNRRRDFGLEIHVVRRVKGLTAAPYEPTKCRPLRG